jgi:hypothetical protein
MYIYNEAGEIQNGWVVMQVKATDRVAFTASRDRVLFRVRRKDLDLWLAELYPVILILYDARTDMAYWLYVQASRELLADIERSRGETVTVRVPITNILNVEAMRRFALFSARVLGQVGGEIIHHED